LARKQDAHYSKLISAVSLPICAWVKNLRNFAALPLK
jgi:hypothetical protein